MYWSDIRQSLKRTVAPTVEPVTVPNVKTHSRVADIPDEDSLAAEWIQGCREMVEVDCQVALCTQTWTLQFDQFPCDAIEVPIWPLVSATIAYVDSNGDAQTLSASNYIVNTASKPGRIALAYNTSWPIARCQENSVTVTFVAGFGNASAVPQIYKQAIRLLGADCFENRGAVGTLTDEQLTSYRSWISRGMWSGGYR